MVALYRCETEQYHFFSSPERLRPVPEGEVVAFAAARGTEYRFSYEHGPSA